MLLMKTEAADNNDNVQRPKKNQIKQNVPQKWNIKII